MENNQKRLFFSDALMLIVCAVILLGVSLCIFLLPSDSFSEEENRALSPMPNMRIEEVLSGRYFERLSLFYADALPMRTGFIKLKAFCELALGRAQNNGVIFAEDGRLLDRCEYDISEPLYRNLDIIKKYDGTAERFACALVPRAIDVYSDSDESRRICGEVYSRCGDDLLYRTLKDAADAGERVYYKTDHHLDADGVYILYSYIVSSLGEVPLERASFSEAEFSSAFYGSTYSSCGLIAKQADTVTLFEYCGDDELDVHCLDKGCTLRSVYDRSALGIKDKYKVFTGGNHGVLKVTGEGEKRSLLLIKDSFANALVPMLARHFDLTVLDPRYASELEGEFDCTAVVMGIDTVATTRLPALSVNE